MAEIAKIRLIQIDHLMLFHIGINYTSAGWRKPYDHGVYLMRFCDDSGGKIVQLVAVVLS